MRFRGRGAPLGTVDVDAVHAKLANPTASAEQVRRWLLQNIQDLARQVDTGTTLFEVVDLVAADPTAPAVERGEGQLQGTEVYLRVACPGPGSDPDADFAFGTVTLESPLLHLDDLEELGVRGDLLLLAQDCERGDSRLDGAATAWYDAPDELLVLEGELGLTQQGEGLSVPLAASLGATWSFLVPVFGAHAALDVSPERPETGRLRYAGGAFACELDPPLACWPE